MVGTLNDTQIANILTSQVIGRLACADDKLPYVVPVTFAYDGAFIYGQTNEGTKLDILRRNPQVCFEVDTLTDMRNWQSVIIYGEFEELRNHEAEAAKQLLFNRIYPLASSSTVNGFGHGAEGEIDDSTRLKFVMYRIRIRKLTGRFERQ